MKKSVLVVEDQSSQRKIMVDALQKAGYAIYQAADVQQAIQLLHQHKPDVLVADMHLPSGDGREVIREARQLLGEPIAIVAVSIDLAILNQSLTATYAADAYLSKPFHPRELLKIVDELVGIQL
ncbi:response regulator [Larkinella arboricola]|uniref:Two-component system phosphate regulon response regulator PhoB n=1 Tax=Larkinella arboricola TaxID=643671 RepID=A0A327WS45_LARAB|nr:response regulator [Larkinella arboricola]RAJ94503.1 two-component system phosphate regulon response regulator PhoB [Larkinella arboricola]